MSHDNVLKAQNSNISYEQTQGLIGLKLALYLSREVFYQKIDMTSPWRHHLILNDLLTFVVIQLILTISSELNEISENFFLNMQHR